MSELHEALVRAEPAEALAALREFLAGLLVQAEPGQGAGLAKEFRAVLEAQAAVKPVEQSTSDALAARRADRLAKAKAAPPPDRGGVNRRPRSG